MSRDEILEEKIGRARREAAAAEQKRLELEGQFKAAMAELYVKTHASAKQYTELSFPVQCAALLGGLLGTVATFAWAQAMRFKRKEG